MAGNKNSGRKPKTHLRAQTIRILAETAPKASAYLRDVVEGKIPPFVKTYTRKDGTIVKAEEPGENPIKVDVCKYVINQDLGTPTQKTVLASDKESPFQSFIFVLPDGTKVGMRDLVGNSNKT